ncbi:MAG: sensor domain-containing diguanylate cyclase [Deltaproteobacteria bacterium]|nr:sensor domain-containing diguanylate cyclase [Deltaproteobacteria bacterium]
MRALTRDAFSELRPRLPVRPATGLPPRLAQRLGVAAPLFVGGLLAFAEGSTGALAAATVVALSVAALALPHVVARATGRRLPAPGAPGPLGVLGACLAVATALTGPVSPVAPLLLAVAVAQGALLPLRRLGAAGAALALALAGALHASGAGPGAVASAVLVSLGFALLGRALFFGTLRAVQVREAARVDGELLRLYDDARLFRLVGRDDDDDGGRRRLVARTLAARDGCYRLLRLSMRALQPDAAALYLLDASGKQLVLKEQIVEGESEPRARLDARVGTPGLALKKGQPIRLVDAEDGVAVQAHRRGARSALAVPLRDGAALRGVLVFDRARPELFSEEHETLALALAEELMALLRTERILDELDHERRAIGRIFEAARAFGGVVRPEDAVATALRTARDLAPSASVALLELRTPGNGEAPTLHVAGAEGEQAAALALGATFPLDGESWLGRALTQRTALPHVALAQAGSGRGLYASDDEGAAPFGDLRVIPLFSQGEPVGALVVAVPAGERLRAPVVDALLVAADLAGVALGGARLFVAVERQATTDGLTGLVNRRTLDQKLQEGLARAQRTRAPLAVVLADIDHFKSVNDTYGHGTGDLVLKAVAGAVAGAARTTDVVARYGGEELCLVLEATDAEGAARLAERMRLAIRALRFDTEKGPLTVSASFGVGMFEAGDDPHALLERADQKLYQAKARGRDRVIA